MRACKISRLLALCARLACGAIATSGSVMFRPSRSTLEVETRAVGMYFVTASLNS